MGGREGGGRERDGARQEQAIMSCYSKAASEAAVRWGGAVPR